MESQPSLSLLCLLPHNPTPSPLSSPALQASHSSALYTASHPSPARQLPAQSLSPKLCSADPGSDVYPLRDPGMLPRLPC